MATGPDPQVSAAGGVIVSSGRVALVHRPRYDDWSLPKGKLDPGETFEECARREVAEETGLRCRLVRELDAVTYVDNQGRTKLVRYWLMEVEPPGPPGAFQPNDEVDLLRWSTPEEAGTLLSYEHDRALVAQADRLVEDTS